MKIETTKTTPSPVLEGQTVEYQTLTADYAPSLLGTVIQNPKPILSALLRLTTSSKGLVVLLVVLGAFVALLAKAATFEQVQDLLKWVLGPWFVASSAEDVSRNLAAGRVETMKVQTANAPPSAPMGSIDLTLKTTPSIAPPPDHAKPSGL